MKKYLIYIALIAVGLVIGKLVFTNNSTVNKAELHSNETKEEHWTCSMHPKIDMPKPGQCPICGMDLILRESGDDAGLSVNAFKMSKNAMALANVQTVVVGNDNKNNTENATLRLSGTIQVNGNTSAMQTAHFGGRLERLYFKTEGEFVKKGSLIASVYSPELVTAQNELLEAMKVKNLQPELYNAVRNKLKNWKISEKQVQQIERNKKVITNFNMYANVSGTIDKIFAQEGDHVKEGTPLFMISNLSTVWAVFDVYEQDIKNLKKGQQIEIYFNAYPNEKIQAKIDFIDPFLHSEKRTISVRVTLKNNANKLRPGMLIYSNLDIDKNAKKTDAVLYKIPKTAVLWTGKRSVVYVKTGEGTFEVRQIELGGQTNEYYNIKSGLKNGEEVVVNGAFTVDAVAQLQGKPSMMEQELLVDDKKEDAGIETIKKIEVSPVFKKQLQAVFNAYFKVKDAFVNTNVVEVAKQAQLMLNSVDAVQMKNLKKPEAHQVWMPAVKTLKSNLKQIIQEDNIEKQRAKFIELSKDILKLTQVFGVNKTVYVQFCPMANNNGGANWLSTEKIIMNPYFGDKMLHCGSVETIIE